MKPSDILVEKINSDENILSEEIMDQDVDSQDQHNSSVSTFYSNIAVRVLKIETAAVE